MARKPNLSISPEKIGFIISLARQFDAKDVLTDVDSGSNPSDDGGVDILEDQANDPVQRELISFINDLNIDEQIELVALTWLGRGDDTVDGWSGLRRLAADAHNERTATYLLGIPLLGDFLEEGATQCGYSVEDLEEYGEA
ncbi:DUF3775 domain-containing protein [Beijerinckia indica]|uniref:DUF3775 domain-containing protein n=1 Tax=Beijerinckia indica subsp. indica (strain ATCC 9039 / DSM 1715 / NCIMB 8712) TaxID=395963 RepID=B2IJF7_BEII9|nr:DUF3775 domain-containing protein [Beijerinckia indica]ACB96270.1 conserved hypothetical protein [Beijerinckia indica subsp. indica ATCC 9039]